MTLVLVLGRNPEQVGVYERQALESRYAKTSPLTFERSDERDGSTLLALCATRDEPVLLLAREADVAFVWRAAQRGIPCLILKQELMTGRPSGLRLHRLSPVGEWFAI